MRTALAKLRDPSRPLLTSLTAPPPAPSPPPLPSPLYLLHFSHYSCIISPCLFRSFPSAWYPFGIRNRNCLIHGNIRREGRRGANKENSRHRNRLPLFSKLQPHSQKRAEGPPGPISHAQTRNMPPIPKTQRRGNNRARLTFAAKKRPGDGRTSPLEHPAESQTR